MCIGVFFIAISAFENEPWFFFFFKDLVGKLKDAAKSVEKASQMWWVQFPPPFGTTERELSTVPSAILLLLTAPFVPEVDMRCKTL